ncbi:MAG: DUF3804 family protein [Candidatus Lokiarchaeota archaeon]|nr:DUF3804 family protein [Candidatus Lokiarchaeota archaeon]
MKFDQEKIRKEIEYEIDNLIIGCEELNLEKAFKVYSKSKDFFMIAGDGYYYDYQTFFNNNKNYFGILSKFELSTIKRDLKILSSDLVIYSWIYRVRATLKSGEQDILDSAGATFLFKKINNTWKVINYQESSAPPIRKKIRE